MTETTTEVVLYEVDEGIATITFNRPDRLNAWTPDLGKAYHDALERAAADPEVRAIVVTGAGRGFCAGADMEVLSGDVSSAEADPRPHTYPLTIPKPIIAAINGPVAGLGLVLALMCDLRFAADDAKFTTAFSKRGLIAEHGISWMLPRLVGPSVALDLLFSARVVLGADAARIGLANRAVPGEELMDEVRAYARELAENCSPTSMSVMKREVYEHLERDLAPSLDEANRLMQESLARPDFREGVRSYLEKRSPDFPGLSWEPKE